jgi:NAD+ synthase (glutamine-hydrolysing)
MTNARVGVASLNQTVGDWVGNVRRIVAVLDEARRRGVRLVIMPEMCIPGYSLCDRLMMRGTLERSWEALQAILPHTEGLVATVGLPYRHRDVLYNVVAVVANGQVCGLVAKENLATGDVQYENRWFAGWPRGQLERTDDGLPIGAMVFEAAGLGRFGVEVCEDGWKGLRPGSVYALAGAHLVANPSASWFTIGKHRVRRHMVEQISREDHVAYLYASLLGCDSTRLIFDGSLIVAQDGQILGEGRRFVFDAEYELLDCVVDLSRLERTRMEEGSWRQQVEGLQRGAYGPPPQVIGISGHFPTAELAAPEARFWEAAPGRSGVDPSLDWLVERRLLSQPFTEADLPHLELELALALGLREYIEKSNIPGFALALSGGRDSAMVAVLVARALRYHRPELSSEALAAYVRSRFVTTYLRTTHSSDLTRSAARALAEELGAEHLEADIQPAVDLHVQTASAMLGEPLSWDDPADDLTLQNVQARLRGSLVWMVANKRRFLLLTTSNQSEAAVGYATMDGDTSGGLCPLGQVPKSLVSAWVAWAARFHGLAGVHAVLAQPPTAELRPAERAQTDEDDLMPFFILDQLMFQFVQRGLDPLELFRTLWPALSAHYGGDPRRFAADIRRFVRMFCQAQWKRERIAIGFRVGPFDLDPKSGFRFPPVQEPFTVELAELDRWVDSLAGGVPG